MTAYEMSASLVGSEMCIRDRPRSGEALSHRHAGADSRADVHDILERRHQD